MKSDCNASSLASPMPARKWECLSLLLPLLFLLGLFPATAVRGDAEPSHGSLYALQATLLNQEGERVSWSDLQGEPYLVSMVYTRCRMSCPLIIQHGMAIQHQLMDEGLRPPRLMVISMDPAHDVPEVLKGSMALYGLIRERAVFLQPLQNQERAIAALLGIRYRQREDGGFDHTNVWLLLDSQGRIKARTEKIAGIPDPGFVKQVRAFSDNHYSQGDSP